MDALIKIIEIESLRTILLLIIVVVIGYFVFHLFIKHYIEDITKTISNFNDTIKANNEATKIVIFYELQREYYEKKEKGGKSINADERFQKMWLQYEKLGNGFGHSLKDEWDALPII